MAFIKEIIPRSCFRSLIVDVISLVIGIPLVCLCLGGVFMVNVFDMDPAWLVIGIVVFLAAAFGGSTLAAVLVTWRRSRILDAALTPLGFTGMAYQMFYRRYTGQSGGKEASLNISRGPRLEFEIVTALQTRLGIAWRNSSFSFLAPLFNNQVIPFSEPEFEGFTVFSREEPWARELLAQPGAAATIRRLIGFDGGYIYRSLILQPGFLRLTLYGTPGWMPQFFIHLTLEQARGWFNDLLALARLAEGIRAPQVQEAASGAEQLSHNLRRQKPVTMPLIAAGLALVLLLFFALVGVGAYLFAVSAK